MVGQLTQGVALGYHLSGLQPSHKRAAPPRRIVAELDALQAEVDALKRRELIRHLTAIS